MTKDEIKKEILLLVARAQSHWVELDKENYSNKRIEATRVKLEEAKSNIISLIQSQSEQIERLVNLLNNAHDLFVLEENSVFRLNNPYGKEVAFLRKAISETLASLHKNQTEK